MKRNSTLAVAAAASAMLLFSCGTGEERYTISGTSLRNGNDTIYIMNSENNGSSKVLDSIIVRNGRFRTEGRIAYPTYCVLSDNKVGSFVNSDFFLEQGDIEMKIDERGRVTVMKGGENNEKLSVLKNDLNPYFDRLFEIGTSLKENMNCTLEERTEAVRKANAINDTIKDRIISFAEENITNRAGVHFFKQTFSLYDYRRAHKLCSMIPDKFKMDDIELQAVAKIIEDIFSTSEGHMFKDLEMIRTNGSDARLSDFAGKGKVIAVDVWAPWCPDCIKEIPDLKKINAKYSGKDFEMIGIVLDTDISDIQEGMRKYGIDWTQLTDLRKWRSSVVTSYGIKSIPHTILIDKDGTIVARGLSPEELDAEIARLLEE